MSASPPRIGEQLMAAGLVTPEALERGLALQKERGGFLIDVLFAQRLVDERAVLHLFAEQQKARYITSDKLAQLKLAPELLEKVPVRHAERILTLPLAFDAATATLTLALAELDPAVIEQVRLASGALRVVAILATRPAIRAGIKRFYYSDPYAFAAMGEETSPRAVLKPESPGKVLAREVTGVGPVAKPGEPASAVDVPKLQRELQLYRVANELARHLSHERDEEAILFRVLAFAFDNLPADNGVLLSIDPATRSLTPKAVRSRAGGTDVIVSETLLQEVLTTRQGVLTGDAQTDERFRRSESVVSAGLRSAMGVPLVVESEVVGVLFLDTRGRIDVFSEGDLQLLMAIASQAANSLENARLSRRIAAETATRANLARFFSPALVEQAAQGAFDLAGGGEIQEVTVLFADVRGFTAISERRSPREVVSLLNSHFEQMVEAVFSHGGVLDKFIGDAVMAIWGVPRSRPDDASRACRAALEMVSRVAKANERRAAQGEEPLRIGIGINTGPVVFGAIGSTRRLEFTAIGDAVNTAARLCDRAEPQQVVASESTVRATQGAFVTTLLSEAKLKGKARVIQAFAITGERELIATGNGGDR